MCVCWTESRFFVVVGMAIRKAISLLILSAVTRKEKEKKGLSLQFNRLKSSAVCVDSHVERTKRSAVARCYVMI